MTVSTAPPLAIELILDILEIVHESELRRPTKRSSIVQCATVCKAWAPICQALLFQNVALPTLRSSIAFANAVRGSTGKAAWLRALVQSFEVTVCDEEDGRVITQLEFAHILHMLPNAKELRLFYYCLRPLDLGTLDILRTIPAPVSLSLRSAQDPSPLWDLLSVWPTIQHLEVVAWEMPTDHITKPPTGRWAPYEVRWLDESDSAEGVLPRLLRPGSLRILQLMKTPEAPFFEELMRTHGPYLRSLRLKALADDVAQSVKDCTVLEEFKYLQIPSPTLLKSLPPTVEHLSFQNVPKTKSITHVIEWIDHHAPQLRVVTYNACGSPTEQDFHHLVSVCRARGIELQCFADTPPTRESEPLVRPRHFPRRATLAPGRRPVPTQPIQSLAVPQPKELSNIRLSPSRPARARTKPRRMDTSQGLFDIRLGL